jgi:hypothetical protein
VLASRFDHADFVDALGVLWKAFPPKPMKADRAVNPRCITVDKFTFFDRTESLPRLAHFFGTTRIREKVLRSSLGAHFQTRPAFTLPLLLYQIVQFFVAQVAHRQKNKLRHVRTIPVSIRGHSVIRLGRNL